MSEMISRLQLGAVAVNAMNAYLDLLRESLVNAHYQHLISHEMASSRWSKVAYTGVDREGLENIRHCCRRAIVDQIPGHFLEAGVWQGGASIFAAGVWHSSGEFERNVFVLDGFSGMPKPNFDNPNETVDYSELTGLKVSQEEVEENFRKFGLLEYAKFIPGMVADSLPVFSPVKLAVIRLDVDYYEPTKICLDRLYDMVPAGGFIIVDDYDCVPSCNRAVDQFLDSRSLSPQLERVNARTCTGIWWRKE